MFAKKHLLFLSLLMLAVTACGSGSLTSPSEDGTSNPATFSASAATAVSVDLAWPAVAEATGYSIEAKYGSGDYFEVAEVGSDQTAYTHFVVPNSTQITYRLSAVVDGGNQEIGVSSVDMPALEANPVVLDPGMPFAPTVGEMPIDFTAISTIDPLNPDPNALATMAAMMGDLDVENLQPEIIPVSVTQTIGASGGTIGVTDPNGLSYELEIPEATIEEDTVITLDPIESFADFPFDPLLGAVHIYPPIPFRTPLTLRITLAEELVSSGDSVIAFQVSSFNQELSLLPVYQDGTTYLVNVYWGDTIGIATAHKEEILLQAARIPSDTAEQISQQMALMQAITVGDPEAFADLLSQLLEAIYQTGTEGTSQRNQGISARLAAPTFQSGSRAGVDLWNKIAAAERATSEVVFNPQAPGPISLLSDQMGNSAGRGMYIANLAVEIKQFLDTHTGCRTRDEFYAQVFLELLVRPKPGFQKELADNFRSQFGAPTRLKSCLFLFEITESTLKIEVKGTDGGIYTIKAHTFRFPLQAIVRGNDVTLKGNGSIIYDDWTDLFTDCPPAIRVTPLPMGKTLWITDLHPVFDEDLKVINFKLQGVDPGPITGSFGGSSIETKRENNTCRVVKSNTGGDPVDMWSPTFAGLHSRYVNFDNWIIEGETSYTATNTVSNATPRSGGSVTEVTNMVLTVTQE